MWSGKLTVHNIEDVADRIWRVIEGKPYTFVANNEAHGGLRPEVRVAQQASKIRTWYEEEKKFGGFHVDDSYGVWGCSTNAQDDAYEPAGENPYIEITDTRIEIRHRAPAGHKLYWVIAVEE